MSAEGAFWLYDNRDEKWRYFLVSTLFGRINSRELYLRLNEALSKTLSERETQDFLLYIASPSEKFVRDIRGHIKTDRHTSDPKSATVKIGGKMVKAWIYRLATQLNENTAKRVQRRFRRRTNELKAA